MVKFNKNLLEMNSEKSFQSISKEIKKYKEDNPQKKIVSLGIGDVSLPIILPIIKAMHKAVDDLSSSKTFKGYGAYYGYDFLKEKILKNEYNNFNFTKNEIYISDGAKTDVTSILELFDIDSTIAIPSIMYPIYKDGSLCLNRKIEFLKVDLDNNFFPCVPEKKFDLIYLCSPNNPTGTAYSFKELKCWVDYAIKYKSIILYDNVYFAFITDETKPKSIYEIENAKKVAIEFRSFSKKASFTGVRCSYFVIPKEINKDINILWQKRTINRFNGADYISQRGAEASFLLNAQKLISKDINYYLENAKILKTSFLKLGFNVYGGTDSPYLWIKIKENLSSLEYFRYLLEELNIIIIPGIVFGIDGDNYFRVSALGHRQDIKIAIERLEKHYE